MLQLRGQTLNGYHILDELARGGMATIFLANQLSMNRRVVVKILPPEFLHDATFRARFQQEVKIAARLEHHAIVPVYDYGEWEGMPYIVMRYMEGGSLDQQIRHRPLTLEQTQKILRHVAPALDYAHSQDVLHRDLKPNNILLDQVGDAYLTDFGIARLLDSHENLTMTGVVGTPLYMSPEQAQGFELDGRSDVYALGVMLYEMLTGELPFSGETPYAIALMHVTKTPPSPRIFNKQLPLEAERVILKSLAKNPADRYPTAQALAQDLDHIAAYAHLAETLKSQLAPAAPTVIATPAPKVNYDQYPPTNAAIQPVRAERPSSPIPPRQISLPISQPEPKKRSRGRILGLTFLLIVVWGVALYVWRENQTEPLIAQDDPTPTQIPRTTNPNLIAQAPSLAVTPLPTRTIPTATPSVTPTPSPTFTPTRTPTPSDTAIPVGFGGNLVTQNADWTPVIQTFDGVQMVLVPAGCFMMGSEAGYDDEIPEHEQCFVAPFWLDRLEVSNAQFFRFQGLAQRENTWKGDQQPRVLISWAEALTFCRQRNARLPTEAEWEYAAHGIDGLAYPWGDEFEPDYLVYSRTAAEQPANVGSHPEGMSWVGAEDMSGNVWEWVSTIYSPYPYRADRDRENLDNLRTSRVVRGGSWLDSNKLFFRTTNRYTITALGIDTTVGFRCARDYEE